MQDTSRPISRRLRFEILRRDEHRCRYCGASADEAQLTVDHVIPRSLGGLDDPKNLVTACFDCNSGKSSISPDSPIVEEVAAEAERYRLALRRAAERDRQLNERYLEELERAISAWADEWFGGLKMYGHRWSLPSDAKASLSRFLDMGLTVDDLIWATELTFIRANAKNDGWRYFCGICWNTIRTRSDAAISDMAKEDAR